MYPIDSLERRANLLTIYGSVAALDASKTGDGVEVVAFGQRAANIRRICERACPVRVTDLAAAIPKSQCTADAGRWVAIV